MAYLQVSQLGIHGEDSWWQLFDLVTVQVPGVKRNTVWGPFFWKETLASASLYILPTPMQADKTSLERE